MAHRFGWIVWQLKVFFLTVNYSYFFILIDFMKDIVLTTINAKWIHPSLALRLLKANLGVFEDRCEIIEFNLRQPADEKIRMLLEACPRVLGISVSIWNHTQTIELLEELEKIYSNSAQFTKPVTVLGGPEVSHLPSGSHLFKFADYIIRGEGETSFRLLCEDVLINKNSVTRNHKEKFINSEQVKLTGVKSAYHLYTDEDLAKKLIYVESGRGCPYGCEFCLSAIDKTVREFPLEPFLAQMDLLIQRGAGTFKFLDRSFNINIPRALRIIEFFLEHLCASGSLIYGQKSGKTSAPPFVVHFEMVPSLFPGELRRALSRFPPGTLRLEIGIQTLNPEVSARIGRPSNPEKELEVLRFLRENTNAVIHADLIAGLPGEDMASFGSGFDRLLLALCGGGRYDAKRAEIQAGILKLLPGTPVARHNESFGMCYSAVPPYEVIKTSAISDNGIRRLKNFARFWELIVSRGLQETPKTLNFNEFMNLSDSLFAHFGRNWGIDKAELLKKTEEITFSI